MTTLFDVSGRVRRFMLFLLLGVFIYLSYVNISSYFSYQNELPKAKDFRRFYMEPLQIFGSLKKVSIPSVIERPVIATYTIDGVHNISAFPDVAYVYSIEKPRQSALSVKNAQEIAQNLGFNPKNILSEENSIYVWENELGTRRVQYDTINRNWKMTTDLKGDKNASNSKVAVSTIKDYESLFFDFVEELGIDRYKGLKDGFFRGNFIEFNPDFSVKETFFSRNADFVYLNLFRKLVFADLKPEDNRPPLFKDEVAPPVIEAQVFGTNPKKGQLQVLVSNDLRNPSRDVYEFSFTEFEFGPVGSYLIIDPNEAWTRFQEGEGSIVSFIPEGKDMYYTIPKEENILSITVNPLRTTVGYWESEKWENFSNYLRNDGEINVNIVYPIYVFYGKAKTSGGLIGDIIIFIDAIKRI